MGTIKCKSCGWTQTIYYGQTFAYCYNCAGTLSNSIPPVYKANTQKAKGIAHLNNFSFDPAQTLSVLDLFPVDKPLPAGWTLPEGKVFARPCPPVPEHGFVESRIVSSREEVEALMKETYDANPASELLLCRMIPATLNMIWTPGMLAIGPGHDGATSGKGAISIPLSGLKYYDNDLLQSIGILPDKWPYIEAVQDKNSGVTITQIRSGPELTSPDPDFVPEELTVKAVIQTNGEDLLEWAKVIKGLAPGTVVYHPHGALTDHYSVHCRENNVPILLTRKPEIGQVLKAEPLAPPDPDSMKLGIIAGSLVNPKHWRSSISLVLLCLHNSAALRGQYSFWLGAATSLMIKFGMAALRGEARHCKAQGKGPRDSIYTKHLPRSISEHRAGLSRVTQVLTYGFGDPEASHSFGGKKWGLCGAAMVPLLNAVRDLFIESSPDRAQELTKALNLVVNQAHNGGWWLNKFTDVSAYTAIPKNHPGWVLDAAQAAWDIHQMRDAAIEAWDSMCEQIAGWPETKIKPLSWKTVSMDIQPGAFVLNMKAATVPSTTKITVPMTHTSILALASAKGRVELMPGYVDLVMPDGNRTTVWKESVLDPTKQKVY